MSSGPEQERPPLQQPQAVPQQPPPPRQQQPIPNQAMLPAGFVEDPAGFLATIASQQQSLGATSQLAGPVAAFLVQQEPFLATTPPATEIPSSSQIAALYLQAAAKQLAGDVKVGDMEQEMIRAQQHYEILEAVGAAATQCYPRSFISNSGIIATLGQIMQNSDAFPGNNGGGDSASGGAGILQHAHVEFLHCCVLAEQYRYAERLIRSSWPRPTSTVNSKQVLRYYYLRGMIHIGCDHFRLAHRCFWTCLNVPADVCSKVAIAAWKKLVLVQCILDNSSSSTTSGASGSDSGGDSVVYSDGGIDSMIVSLSPTTTGGSSSRGRLGGSESSTTSLPKAMPNCIGRMLTSYQDAFSTGQQQQRSRTARHVQLSAPGIDIQPQQQQQQLNPITCYMDVSKAFYARKMNRLEELEHKYQQIFREDGNSGLIRQCATKLLQVQVAQLARIYSVVPLSKLANSLLPPPNTGEDEMHRNRRVSAILCQSQISCDIQDDGMVVFSLPEEFDDTKSGNNHGEDASSTLSIANLSSWMALMQKVQTLDAAVATNSKYLALARKDASAGVEKISMMAAGPRGVEDV